jgi:GntR family transcriptional repressor for pyruvate dehydrogenase complex
MPDAFAIAPLPRVSLVESVADRIRDLIESEKLPAGRRLPSELEWSERLGVSRPVVREAIGRLQSIGLVTVSRGRGRGICVGGSDDVVRGASLFRAALAVSPKDERQLQDLRTAVEVHAARLAAEMVTDDQLAELERLAAAIEGAGLHEEGRIQADLAFHRRIVEISKNTVMLNLLIVAQTMIEGSIRENWRRHRRSGIDSRAAHRRIIAALRKHDPEAAHTAMLEHIQGPAAASAKPSRARSRPTKASARSTPTVRGASTRPTRRSAGRA